LREVFGNLVQLAKDSIFYGLTVAGNAFIALFLLPVYTRALSPAEYGVVDLIVAGGALLTTLGGLQADSGVARYYYEVDDKSRRSLLSTGMILRLPVPLLICITVLPWTGQLSQLLFQSPEYARAMSFALLSVVLQTVFGYLIVIFRFQRAIAQYNALAIGRLVIAALLSVYFVIILHGGVEGVILGYLLTDVLFTSIALFMQRKSFTFSFSRHFSSDILSYGLPLLPTTIVMWLRTYIYRILIIPVLGLTAMGIFSSGARISSAVLLIVSAFSLGWIPFAMSTMHDEKHRLIYIKTLTYLTVVLTIFAFVLTLFSYEITHLLLAPDYWASSNLIGFLSGSNAINGIITVAAVGLYIQKKTFLSTVAYLIGTACGIISLILLTPVMGILGAAVATFIGSVIVLVVEYRLAQRHYPIGYEWQRVAAVIILLVAAILVTMYIDSLKWEMWLRAGLKAIELCSFFLILFLLLRRDELAFFYTHLIGIIKANKGIPFLNSRGKH